MNKSLLFGASLFMTASLSPIHAQVDVTDSYIDNARFDDGTMVNGAPKGWMLSLTTSSGLVSVISTEKAERLSVQAKIIGL